MIPDLVLCGMYLIHGDTRPEGNWPVRGPFKCYVMPWRVGVCQLSRKKALQRCKFQHYLYYEGVDGGQIP